MSAVNQLPHLMTVAAFLDWPTPDGSDRWELVEGTPEAMAPSHPRHGAIAVETGRLLLANHLAEARPDCRVISEAGLRPGEFNDRIPDLSVTCGPVDPDAPLVRPVLVIEILSPSNWRRTWGNVSTYQAVPSVLEILVLNSVEIRATVLRRPAEGAWPQVSWRSGDTVTLESIGFSAPLAAFYRTAS